MNGVVDANGEVFDNSGLYVVDASALPQSPGGAAQSLDIGVVC
ncbi:GMC oxidoreductase [Bradyrhizobium liaoningense]